MNIEKDSILDIMPIDNEDEIMEPTNTTKGLEEQEQFPEVANYNPVTYGWELMALRAVHRLRSSTFNKVGSGSATHTFAAKADYPVLVPAVAIEFTTDTDEIQGNVRVEFKRTYWDATEEIHYWEGQFKGLNTAQKGDKEERLIMIHNFTRALQNSKLDAAAVPTKLQRYIPTPHLLADEATDPSCECFDPVQSIEVKIESSVATLKHSVEIITPNSKLWNVYTQSMLAHNLEMSLERYSVNQESSELMGYKKK